MRLMFATLLTLSLTGAGALVGYVISFAAPEVYCARSELLFELNCDDPSVLPTLDKVGTLMRSRTFAEDVYKVMTRDGEFVNGIIDDLTDFHQAYLEGVIEVVADDPSARVLAFEITSVDAEFCRVCADSCNDMIYVYFEENDRYQQEANRRSKRLGEFYDEWEPTMIELYAKLEQATLPSNGSPEEIEKIEDELKVLEQQEAELEEKLAEYALHDPEILLRPPREEIEPEKRRRSPTPLILGGGVGGAIVGLILAAITIAFLPRRSAQSRFRSN